MLLLAAMLSFTACGTKKEETQETKETQEVQETQEETTSDYKLVLYEDLTSKVVQLGEYKGLEATKTVVEVTQEEVLEEVEATKRDYAETITVEREAKQGDIVLIDYTGYVDGETSDGLQGSEYPLELGSGSFIPGFEDQLVGANAGDEVEVNVTFPEEYHSAEMAGKDAKFDVVVHEVQAYDFSFWNDEFIHENLGYENEEALVSSIREEKEQQAQSDAQSNLEYDLILKFLENSEFEIQEADVNAYLDEMMSEYESYAAMYGVDLTTFIETYMGTTEEQLRIVMNPTAEFRTKMTLAFHEVAVLEGIEISEDEYQAQLDSMAENYGYEDGSLVEEAYSQERIKEQMIQEKVIALIVEEAVIS